MLSFVEMNETNVSDWDVTRCFGSLKDVITDVLQKNRFDESTIWFPVSFNSMPFVTSSLGNLTNRV